MRERLRLVEDDDAVGDAVKLPAPRRPIGEETLKELHGGRDDDRGVPVLHGQLQLFARFPVADPTLVEGAVVLEDEVGVIVQSVSQGIAKDGCGLFDDAHVRDDVDDARTAMANRMIQRKSQ